MLPEIQEDQTFAKINASDPVWGSRQFENCKFVNCDLANGVLNGILFIDCKFEDCNLSLAQVDNSGFQNIRFKHCKLSGINFTRSQDFLMEMHFENCILDNAVFYRKKNKKATFEDCSMVETDFTEADLSDCKFYNCNLHRAFFSNTILKNADLTTAYNFEMDPDQNNIKKAKFSVHGLPGLLLKYDIRVSE